MPCNLEHRLKFESGLTIGRHLIALQFQGHERRAIVEIGKRGAVYMLAMPRPTDMYSGWQRIKGDKAVPYGGAGGVIVWGARDPSLLQMFEGDAKPINIED